MSTYTDYRCERKENVTILRKPGCPEFDGFTPQKVIFGNEANYFKGTFEGKVIAKDMALSGVEINDCTINGGVLVDTTLCSDGQKITLTELTSQVSTIDRNLGILSDDVNELKTKSSSISASISSSLSAVSSDIMAVVNELVETSCEKLFNDISAVSSEILSTIDEISNSIVQNITSISNVLSTEINERILADNYISGQLSTLSTDFSEHVFQNKEDFKYMEKFVLSSIEQDKHYQIYESKIVTESVPYKLHDFGINIVEDRIGNSILKLDEQPIGYATQYTLDDVKYIDIHIENALENALLSSVVPNTYHIVLKLDESKAIEYNSGLYSITYESPSDETYVLNISSTATEYIKVFGSGELIGTITDFEYLDSDAKTLLSGILHIAYNSNATNFCDFYGVFDGNMFTFTDTVRDIFDPTRKLRIQFNTDGKSFLYEKNVSEKHFTNITSNDGSGDIGRVYQDTYISADDGHLSSLVFESSRGLGTATISEDSSYIGFFSDSSHIVKLNSDNVFKIYEANTFYRYEFSSGGDDPTISGFIKPSNHQTLNDENESLSVTVTAKVLDDGVYTHIDNTYMLAKNPTGPSWVFVDHDVSTGQFISIKYESSVLSITGNFGGIALDSGGSYVIDESAGIRAYSDETLIVTSTNTTFDFIGVAWTSPLEDRFHAEIENEITSVSTISIPDISIEDIPLEEQCVKYEIPAKKTEYYGCSREFIIASKIFASTPDVEIRFSCDGTVIKIQDDHGLTTFTQPSNTLVVMKVNEIGQNSFLVTYLTHDKINSWINGLSALLSTETSNRIAADDSLSIEFNTKLDNEISSRILADDTLSIAFDTKLDNEISTRIKIDGELSAQISANIISITDLWKNIRGGLNYQDNLCIDINYTDGKLINDISGLIFENIERKYGSKITGDEIKCTKLREGFFYVLVSNKKTERRYLDGHELEYGDWLIIKNNTILSDLKSTDVSIFDAQDYDSFRLSNDNVISGNNVFNGSLTVNASTTFNGPVEITTTLSSNNIYVNDGVSATEFIATESIRSKSISSETLDSNDVKSETLSVDLSAKIDKAYVNNLTSTIGDIYSLTSETVSITTELTSPAISGTNVSSENLTVENANIAILNNTISAEFPKANINDATVEELSATSLTSDNASISTVIASSVTTTTLSANEITSPSISATTIEVSVEYASYASISTAEVSSLCVASNATIENLDATRSTINELSIDDLSVDHEYVKQSNIENLIATQVEISSTNISCATIENLSIDFSNIVNTDASSKYKDIDQFITSVELSIGSINTELSNRISTDIKISGDLSDLSVQVGKDVEYLSSELSDYHNTLSGIDRLSHTPDTISTDNLMITDVGLVIEGTKHPMYYMTMISGSIVLKKIS